MKYSIYLIGAITMVMASCKTSTYLSVMRPADITLPDHIKTMALVNRTKPAKGGGNQLLNVLEGIATGEGIMMDREGADHSLTGVTDVMLKTPRFAAVKPATILEKEGTDRFPVPLAWDEVEKLCQQNNADALVTLEVFDSDHIVKTEKKEKTVKNKDGTTHKVTEFEATDRTVIHSGWRIYDPVTKQIVDEYRGESFRIFSARGSKPEDAIAALPVRREMVNEAGYHAGQSYGYRIAPMPVRVHRYFYNGGSDEMKIAKRSADVGDWDEAATIWKTEAETAAKEKVRGKAAYNMALAAEVQGKLELALMWAQKSYKEYGNKKAISYVNILRRRIADEKKLKEQMKDGA